MPHLVSHQLYSFFHILHARGFYLHETRNSRILIDVENDLAKTVRGTVFLGGTLFDATEREEDIRHIIVGFELGLVFVSPERVAIGEFGLGGDDAFAIDFSESHLLSFGIPEKLGVDVRVEDFFSTELFEGADDFGFVDFEDFDFDF